MTVPQPATGIEAVRATEHLSRLSAARSAAMHRPLTPEETSRLDKLRDQQCPHCLGWHARACPKVKAVGFYQNGNLASVEYWAPKDIDWDGVVFDNPADASGSETQ